MSYVLFALGGLILALLGIFYLSRRKPPKLALNDRVTSIRPSPQMQLHKLQQSANFWGVRVESHCRASSRLAGKQFVFDEAPVLPVEGCESAACNCVLVGLPERRQRTDRRTGEDRRRSLRMESNDRRGERPRRKSDLNSWGAYSHL